MTESFEFFDSVIDPRDHDCDWCVPVRPAAHAFEIKRRGKHFTGQFVWACERHKEIAEISADQKTNREAA